MKNLLLLILLLVSGSSYAADITFKVTIENEYMNEGLYFLNGVKMIASYEETEKCADYGWFNSEKSLGKFGKHEASRMLKTIQAGLVEIQTPKTYEAIHKKNCPATDKYYIYQKVFVWSYTSNGDRLDDSIVCDIQTGAELYECLKNIDYIDNSYN